MGSCSNQKKYMETGWFGEVVLRGSVVAFGNILFHCAKPLGTYALFFPMYCSDQLFIGRGPALRPESDRHSSLLPGIKTLHRHCGL